VAYGQQAIADIFELGRSHHEAGRLAEAENCYRQVLAVRPNHADALHRLGTLARRVGRPDVAIELISQAIRCNATNADYLSDLGKAFDAGGKPDEAVAAYREAIRIKPDFAEAYCNLAVSLGRQGKLDEAVAACYHAIRIKPSLPEAYANLGMALDGQGKLDEAVAAYREAIRIKPDLVEAYCNLGIVLRRQGNFDEAVFAFRQSLALHPNHTTALFNLVAVLTDQGRLDEAVQRYEQALSLGSDVLGVGNKLGLALFERGHFAKALACYRSALRARPDAAATLVNYGAALTACGRPVESIASFKRAVAAAPDNAMFHSGLIFALNFDPAATLKEHQAERSRWDMRHARGFAPWEPHPNDRSPNRRLRIGYVSPYFCRHSATYAFGGVIVHHDRDQFEVVCYSDTAQEDDISARLRSRADKWQRTARLRDDELAALIRTDRIDILVDLVGHMRGHRLLAFARKPAPIQVTAWGEPTGTGLAAMDYLFADRMLIPPNERELLAEQVVDLPNFLGYWAPDPVPEPRALPALTRGYVTFGSFNRFDKIQDAVLAAWARIMSALAGSRLILKGPNMFVDPTLQERVKSIFETAGVAAERVSFLGWVDRDAHFEAYQGVDIALDPFPHGGGMTSLDALWMGIPVVTFPGRTISSRLASASLSAAGLRDFVARDLDDYVDLVVAKASNFAALALLRSTLRGLVANSAFGDPMQYSRVVEQAYRKMWQRWCAAAH
jgi:predicted O-linked N-acetylglucosamine transferase (SPINDLY family)